MSNRYFINVKDEDLLPQAKKNFDELRRDILNSWLINVFFKKNRIPQVII